MKLFYVILTLVIALNITPSRSYAIEINGEQLEYLPIKHVRVRYPERALQRRVSGTCKIGYTVSKEGKTKDLKVIECTHKLFIKPSMDAAKKFEYVPIKIERKK